MSGLGCEIGRGPFTNAGLEYQIVVYQNGKLHTVVAHRRGTVVAQTEANVVDATSGVTVNDLIRQVQDAVRNKR